MSETLTKIRRFTLNADTWTPIIAPAGCNFWMVTNCDEQNAIWRCSDPDNDAAFCSIPAGDLYSLIAPVFGPRRYESGDTITYLKAMTGTPTVIVEFIL